MAKFKFYTALISMAIGFMLILALNKVFPRLLYKILKLP